MEFNSTQVERHANQIIYKIINSRLVNYPYPHAETLNILPYNLLDEVENNFPDKDEFISHSKSDSVKLSYRDADNKHPYDFRYQIYLTRKDHISRIKDSKLIFWKFFTKVITSPMVIRSLLALYNKHLQQRFGESLKDMLFYPDLMLLHDKANYSLGPHTDISDKVIVILIYLSSDNQIDSMDSYGTSVYIPKKTGFTCEGKTHHDHEDFYKIYTSSFKRNNSLSFFRTNNSFHGVETVPDKPIERKLLQLSIMLRS